MEDHSAVDIGIRNVPVRLNEPNVAAEMNGGCMYLPAAIDSETKVTCFGGNSGQSDLVDEMRNKLHVCIETDPCSRLNGCNKTLHQDLKLSINGLNKCNIELISSQLVHLNQRTSTWTDPGVCKSSDSMPAKTLTHDCDSQFKESEGSSLVPTTVPSPDLDIRYLGYESELQMPDIMRLIQKDLSEPYSIYTYRYFIHNWPKLCFLALDGNLCVGAIVCKLDVHKKQSRRGYIAMLAVDEKYRKRKIGSNLVLKAIQAMVQDSADEVVLETEITNKPALRLYENLGFVRDKRLFRYYLNGVDALRLKLWLR